MGLLPYIDDSHVSWPARIVDQFPISAVRDGGDKVIGICHCQSQLNTQHL